VYAVPTIDMFETSAYQLSGGEVEKTIGFFSKLEGCGVFLEKVNPVEIPGKELRKLPPGNPNAKSFKGGKLLRSCFYNSGDYSLESEMGVFSSQALHFKDKKSYAAFREDALKGFDKSIYSILWEKGNIHAATSMYLQDADPTKEFWEIVDFTKSKGFKILAEDWINER